MNFGHLFLSLEGRIGRQEYWIGIIILLIPSIVLTLVSAFFVIGAHGHFNANVLPDISTVMTLILIYPSIALMTKRLNDRGRSLWFLAVIITPSLMLQAGRFLEITHDPGTFGGMPALILNTNGVILTFITIIVGIWSFIELGCLKGKDEIQLYS